MSSFPWGVAQMWEIELSVHAESYPILTLSSFASVRWKEERVDAELFHHSKKLF